MNQIISSLHEETRKFYQDFFHFDCPDLASLTIPESQVGFDLILPIVAINQTEPVEAALQCCERHFPCRNYTDQSLDLAVPTHDRDPRTSYIIRLRDRNAADEEFMNLSANELAARQILGITLYERIILEAWHYVKTGQHLDHLTVTLCAGSRDHASLVPFVRWSGGEFGIERFAPNYRSGLVRTRQVIAV